MLAEFIDPAILGFILIGVMLFAIFIGYEIIADLTQFGILDSISFLNTPFSIISTLIFLFLIFKNSDTDKDDHEG